jgi:hypothetical protein
MVRFHGVASYARCRVGSNLPGYEVTRHAQVDDTADPSWSLRTPGSL